MCLIYLSFNSIVDLCNIDSNILGWIRVFQFYCRSLHADLYEAESRRCDFQFYCRSFENGAKSIPATYTTFNSIVDL